MKDKLEIIHCIAPSKAIFAEFSETGNILIVEEIHSRLENKMDIETHLVTLDNKFTQINKAEKFLSSHIFVVATKSNKTGKEIALACQNQTIMIVDIDSLSVVKQFVAPVSGIMKCFLWNFDGTVVVPSESGEILLVDSDGTVLKKTSTDASNASAIFNFFIKIFLLLFLQIFSFESGKQ